MAQPTVLDSPADGTHDDAAGAVGLEDGLQHDSVEPAAKRLKTTSPTYLGEPIPKQFMAKFIATGRGIVPYVKNMETGVIHCGFDRMKVNHFKSDSGIDDYKSVICLSGCFGDCKQEGQSPCDCSCHHLQKDYDARSAKIQA